ncbi:hypothetical protein [Prosthecochloris vibrioformis]|uniref:DUF3619 family protein n=1 Tax=Prosthecochloris vibrioformis TaxID=1098 RepID=A0A5C4S0I4_PROVB|nr:hypothetical protein [Prosthecochloris vibrioformis]TNJ36652.1 hypothetical protein FGF68_06205 [Prosthecochloris vibrioformis]
MHHKQRQIEQEAAKTLAMLDSLPSLEAHHLFRARVLERLAEEAECPASPAFMNSYVVKMALMILLLAVNIVTAILIMQPAEEESMLSKSEMLEIISDDYGSPAISYYLQDSRQEEE